MKMLRMSDEQAAAHQQRMKTSARKVTLLEPLQRNRDHDKEAQRREKGSRMNKTETLYAQELELLKRAGEIIHWGFEEVTLRLATGARFTPDFLVIVSENDPVQLREVKGFWREAARVRIKVAADKYPFFKFRAVTKVAQKHGGGWREEHFR